MKDIEVVLRKQTMNMFGDGWYKDTSNLLNQKIFEEEFGYVYFIRIGTNNNIKIGKTSNLTNRLKSFRTSTSESIFLIGFIYDKNFSKIEKLLHNKYSDLNVVGEWFNIKNINDITKENNFVAVNKYFIQKSLVFDGEVFNFSEKDKYGTDSYYSDFYVFCKTNIVLNQKIYYNSIYPKIRNIKKEYSQLSSKKINLKIQDWCSYNNLTFKPINSNGFRGFIAYD